MAVIPTQSLTMLVPSMRGSQGAFSPIEPVSRFSGSQGLPSTAFARDFQLATDLARKDIQGQSGTQKKATAEQEKQLALLEKFYGTQAKNKNPQQDESSASPTKQSSDTEAIEALKALEEARKKAAQKQKSAQPSSGSLAPNPIKPKKPKDLGDFVRENVPQTSANGVVTLVSELKYDPQGALKTGKAAADKDT